MSSHTPHYEIKNLSPNVSKWGFGLLGLGLVLAVLGFTMDHNNSVRLAYSSLIAFMFLMSIGLGSLFLIAVEYIAGAVWSLPFRRIAETLASLVIIAPIFAIPVLMNMHHMYEWTNLEVVAKDNVLSAKAPYLNMSFFYGRFIGIIAMLGIFYWAFTRNSIKQDTTGDQGLTKANVRLSALFLPLFAIGLTMLAIDFMMSLEPHWFSTIFGVYYFAGSFWAGISVIAFIAVKMNAGGMLGNWVNKNHFYSLGGFMFAFTAFWTYIAFSQFMLIWYANLPEETFWFIPRMAGGWSLVSISLIVLHFIVPFFLLIQKNSKTNPARLTSVAVLVVFVHILDLYWLTYPSYSKHLAHTAHDMTKSQLDAIITTPVFGFLELGFIALALGVLITVFNMGAKGKNMIPLKDPKLQRAIDFHL